MNETQAVARMQQLIAEINRASYAYYVLDNPIMSDKEWDRLYYELLDLEKEFDFVFHHLGVCIDDICFTDPTCQNISNTNNFTARF